MDKFNENEFLTCIGLMSGTSMDGIDGVVMNTDGINFSEVIAYESIQYDARFGLLLKAAEFSVRINQGNLLKAKANFTNNLTGYIIQLNKNPIITINQLNNYLDNPIDSIITFDQIIYHSTILHLSLIKILMLKENKIDLIGYHGQTLYHQPKKGISISVGDAQLIADQTKIKVVSNFRINDLNNKGQGAPLVPIYHQSLAKQSNYSDLIVINCGGIANITVIKGESLIGFDTGPGNVLIDRYIKEQTSNQEIMDKNGYYANQGQIQYQLTKLLYHKSTIINDENYFTKSYPKSLDSGDCQLITEVSNYNFFDVCATLADFTAYTIVESFKLIDTQLPNNWVLIGGGWHNLAILNSLKKYCNLFFHNINLLKPSDIGWNSQYIEAELFAYLAARSILKLPFTYPSTTGVVKPCSGGTTYEA